MLWSFELKHQARKFGCKLIIVIFVLPQWDVSPWQSPIWLSMVHAARRAVTYPKWKIRRFVKKSLIKELYMELWTTPSYCTLTPFLCIISIWIGVHNSICTAIGLLSSWRHSTFKLRKKQLRDYQQSSYIIILFGVLKFKKNNCNLMWMLWYIFWAIIFLF